MLSSLNGKTVEIRGQKLAVTGVALNFQMDWKSFRARTKSNREDARGKESVDSFSIQSQGYNFTEIDNNLKALFYRVSAECAPKNFDPKSTEGYPNSECGRADCRNRQ